MFLALVAAASLTCPSPIPADGASLECGGKTPLRLDGITAPAPLDTCKSWEVLCRTDPGTAARDHLADLTRGMTVVCDRQANDRYRCKAAGRDLSCAMITDGFARPAGDIKSCPLPPPAEPLFDRSLIPPVWAIASFLAIVNAVAVLTVRFDQYRQRRGFGAITERLMMLLALIGGGPGIIATQMAMRRGDAGVSAGAAIVLGLQIGAGLGLMFI